MRTKLKSHRWSLTTNTDRTHIRLLCDGREYPAHGPNHTVDFRIPGGSTSCGDGSHRTVATLTDFRTGDEIRLIDMEPVMEPEKRLDARTWWKEQSGFMRGAVKDWMNDRLDAPHILSIMDASMYVHGFGPASFDWLID